MGNKSREHILRDRELSQVVANHLGLDLNLVELLTGVDTDNGADHLGDDDHVTEVGLDEIGLLVGLGLLLGLAELLDETHGLALQAAVETSAGTGVNDITELLGGKVEEPVKGFSQTNVLANVWSLWCPFATQRQRGENRNATCGLSIMFDGGRRPSSNSVSRGTGCEWISKGSMIGNGNVLVEVNTAVRELAELSSLLDLCSANVQSASAILLLCVSPCIPGPCRFPPTYISSMILV